MSPTPGRGQPETSDRRGQVLRAFRDAPGALSIAEVAQLLEIHPNTARFHVDHLIERGLVEQVRTAPRGPGRPASMFRAVPRMDPEGPRGYRVLAEILSQGLAAAEEPSVAATEFGRAWGRAQAGLPGNRKAPRRSTAVGRMVALLDKLGFAPERDGLAEGPQIRIGIRHCPFLELAESRPEVICPAHLGIMQGLAEGWRAPFTVARLDPFVEPDLCLVHLSAKTAGE